MKKLAKVVMLPKSAARKLDELLVFDARCVDADMRRDVLRLLPQLVQLRHAWRSYFKRYGCLACRGGPANTIFIAAQLRQRGTTWAEIYEIIGIDRGATTRAERKPFEYAVRWKLAHLDNPPRGRSHDTTANPLLSHNYHAGAGLCDKCYARTRRRLAKILRKMTAGRNPAEETAALTRRYDLAQQLLNGGDERVLGSLEGGSIFTVAGSFGMKTI